MDALVKEERGAVRGFRSLIIIIYTFVLERERTELCSEVNWLVFGFKPGKLKSSLYGLIPFASFEMINRTRSDNGA